MIRKTFTTKAEALKYKEDIIKQEGVAVVGVLGNKFRVYATTKEMIEQSKSFRTNYTAIDAQRWLHNTAWQAEQAICQALTLQKLMADGSLHNDYESAVDALRIMIEVGELKTAQDVLAFIDGTQKYEKVMNEFIKDTLEEYDYEAKEEVRVE